MRHFLLFLLLASLASCRFEGTDSGNPENSSSAQFDACEQQSLCIKQSPVYQFLNEAFCPLLDRCGHPLRSSTCGQELLQATALAQYWLPTPENRTNRSLASEIFEGRWKLNAFKFELCLNRLKVQDTCQRFTMQELSLATTLDRLLSKELNCQKLLD